MAYRSIEELPDKIRNNLPEHACKIYVESFNNALKEYKPVGKRRSVQDELDAVAHKIAWAAVKKKYKKNKTTGMWEEK